MKHIYLDHNSTTPILPEVAAAMADYWSSAAANPASQHEPGRQARRALEDARQAIASMLGGSNGDWLVFTSGGTEANNLALLGLAAAAEVRHGGPGEIVISAIEHPSVVGPVEHLARSGWTLVRAPVTRQGVLDVDRLQSLISPRARLVAVMLGNNETGVLQPVGDIAKICAERGVPLHVDAIQVVGKLPVDFRSLGATTMALAAHKFHGPCGIGALLLHSDAELAPILHGGFQQAGLRPGTEPVALVIGMRSALENWHRNAARRSQHLGMLRDRLESRLAAGFAGLVINGAEAPRLPHTSNVSFIGLDRRALVMALDLAGVACSTGSACASGSSEPSPVLLAMGCPRPIVESALRFSVGATTTLKEIDEAVERVLAVCERLKAKSRAALV